MLTYWFWASICGPYIGPGLWDIFNSIDRYSPTIYSYFDFEVIHFWRDIYWILVAKSLFLIWVWGQTILEILILGIKLWALLYLRSGTYSILLIHFWQQQQHFWRNLFLAFICGVFKSCDKTNNLFLFWLWGQRIAFTF